MIRYNANVRTGNWFDELMLQEAKTKQYVRKSENGELKVQKARQIFLSLLTEVPLTFPVVGLSYGASIEIVSPENPPRTVSNITAKQGIALASYIEIENSDKRDTFAFNDPVVGTALLTPCRRNVWTLVPEDKNQQGKELRFGDSFYIRLVSSDPPLYVYAPIYKPGNAVGECSRVVTKLTDRKGSHARFKVLHYDPRLRWESEGSVVPPFEKISIVQAASFEGLAVEVDTWFPTYFGMECEVSIHTFKNAMDPRKPDSRNFWSFILSLP